LGHVYMEADTFGARPREHVGAPKEPAGQRQLFPSAAGASAERRIGPRRSFFVLRMHTAAMAGVTGYFVHPRQESLRAWNSRLG
jgi:hypothetical protein